VAFSYNVTSVGVTLIMPGTVVILTMVELLIRILIPGGRMVTKATDRPIITIIS
jgi:hypothetical protein